jgi:hypothetical protein
VGGLGLTGHSAAGPLLLAALPLVFVRPWLKKAQAKLRLKRMRLAWHQNAVDRLDPDWIGADAASRDFDRLTPLREDQIGLFGAGSLFDRICICETEPGRTRLAEWLARSAAPHVVRDRQASVKELAADLSFCTEFGVSTMSFGGLGRLQALSTWLSERSAMPRRRFLLPLLVLMPIVTAVVAISYWIGWLSGVVGLSLTALAGALHLWLGISSGSALGALASDVSQLIESDLETIFALGHVVASQSWNASALIGAQTAILSNLVDSGAVMALRREASLLAFANSDPLWLLSSFFLVPQIAAARLQQWKSSFGEQAKDGIESIADLEALVALGNYAAENSTHCFPRLLETQTATAPVLRAKALGHPLIDDVVCVRNDVHLEAASRYWVISGSNMGGKSTLLRAIGLNLSLAWAGAPVRADSFTTSAGTVVASVDVRDSLQDGQSHFSAEVTILKKILVVAESSSCVVLLDEILSGTNSRDRRVAALEIMRRLRDSNTVGMVTTHDLAVSDELLRLPGFEPKHFAAEDTVEGLQFDYKVRDGEVEGSNGLAVLRMLGIDIEDHPPGSDRGPSPN